MIDYTQGFSGFAVPDVAAAKAFYADVLGLEVSEEHGMLGITLPGGARVMAYPKDDHEQQADANRREDKPAAVVPDILECKIHNTRTRLPSRSVPGFDSSRTESSVEMPETISVLPRPRAPTSISFQTARFLLPT